MISMFGLNILNQKIKEYSIAKQQQALNLQRQKHELYMAKLSAQAYVAANKERIVEEQQLLIAHKETIAKLTLLKAEKGLNALQEAVLEDAQEFVATNETRITQEAINLENAEYTLNTYDEQNSLLESQTGLLGGIGSAISALTGPLFAVIALYKMISGLITTIRNKKAADHKATMVEQGQENIALALGGAGKIINDLGVWGIPIAIAVVAALIGATLGINAAVSNAKKNSYSGQVNSINELSKSIYDLNKKTTALDTVISKFDDLDKKVLKTNADLEEMSSILDSAADSLSDEEKDVYESLSSLSAKRRYIETVKNNAQTELDAKRLEQRNKVLKMYNSSNWNRFKGSNKSEDIQAQDAIYALNNANLYKLIDETNTLNSGTEQLIQTLLEQVDLEKAIAILQNPESIKDYIGQVQKGVEVFMDESKSLRERTDAYRELHSSITDPQMREALEQAYLE